MVNKTEDNNGKNEFEKIPKQTEQLKHIESIIRPFLSRQLSKTKIIELCQVGKFISTLKEDITLIEHQDRPDFLVTVDGNKIGLEHQRIYNDDKVEKIKSIADLIDGTANVFEKKYPNHKVLVNCWLNTDGFKTPEDNIESIQSAIADYVFQKLQNDKNIVRPAYIEKLIVMEHSEVFFFFNTMANGESQLDQNTLIQAINKKNSLVDQYRQNSGLTTQWLLLVIGAIPPNSFKLDYTFIRSLKIRSSFDKIYLLEDYHSKIWQLK